MSNEALQEQPLSGRGLNSRQRRRLLLLVVVPAVVALAGGIAYLLGGRHVDTDNAYVKSDKIAVSADVAGTIAEVYVRDNEVVKAGQPLFRIDPASFKVAVDKAEAKLAQVRTDLAAMKAGYREKQAEIALAQTRYAFARRERQRQSDLVDKHFISAARFDDAAQNADLAGEQIAALQQDLKRIAASLGGSVDAPIERHPAYRAAQAELEQARLDLDRCTVRASLPGTANSPPKPGQYAAAGSMVMALVVSNDVWVEANFTETDLTYVRPGEPATVRVDTYPDAVWHGTVDSLSPATGAEFSVIPAQNATGNWVKVTQRVPVRIKLDAAPGLPPLRAGFSAEVDIDTGHRRSLFGIGF
jgi:membrane fusion protein (multidrug efflux system)